MRSFLAALLGVGVPISIGYAVACGPPASFDFITGGPEPPDAAVDAPTGLPDNSLEPPRPIAPLSGSWVNGSRPQFRWDVATLDGRGTQVELCADRECKDPNKKVWSANGRVLVAPEDVPPGHYFWRLVPTTLTTIGTRASPAWSLIVRGGKSAKNGDVPAGQIMDLNGDGIADIFLGIDMNAQGFTYHDALLLLGSSHDDPTALELGTERPEIQPRDFQSGTTANQRIQTTDVNGDGFSDAIFADLNPLGDAGAGPQGFVFAVAGGVDLTNVDYNSLARPLVPELDVTPTMYAPGDIDGDGYGDLVVGTKKSIFAVYGGAKGLTTFSTVDHLFPFVDKDAGELDHPTAAIPVGGIDINGDGLIDPMEASYFLGDGFLYYGSLTNRAFDEATTFIDSEPDSGNPLVAPAIAFSGTADLDADGETDVVFSTTIGGKGSICASTGASGRQGKVVCYTPPAPPAGFGQSLIAVDLDGDGKDEIVVASAVAGIDIVRLTAPDKLESEHLAVDYGTGLTILDPGAMQKPAVWAAVRPDGAGFGLFRGKDLAAPFTLMDLQYVTTLPIQRVGPALR